MKHKTLEEIAEVAKVAPLGHDGARTLRRQRLERFATLLDAHQGRLRMLSMIEYVPESERLMLRRDDSPLTVAYQDPEFRLQGLSSDRLGDAIAFFDLSMREAHHLFCDCHYSGMMVPRAVTPSMVARRARSLAQKPTFAEVWDKLRRAVLGR